MARAYRELYYRWEREQWEAGAIDLAEDGRVWSGLPDSRRERLLSGVLTLYAASVQMADKLVALVDEVPTEEQQVFLTTHLVDVARHAVFLSRFVEEVARESPSDAVARRDGLHHAELQAAPGPILADLADDANDLVGLSEGLAAIQRDDERHRAFAKLFTQDHGPIDDVLA
jgi:ribonucleoside-diphosphate reductase beta chain